MYEAHEHLDCDLRDALPRHRNAPVLYAIVDYEKLFGFVKLNLLLFVFIMLV